MDNQRDYHRFVKLIGRLCETLGKPITDELTESWWKALKHVDFDTVAEHVDRFLARADEGTKFPRPSQMRPKDRTPPDPDNENRNFIRDYWRTCIVHEVAFWLGIRIQLFENFLLDHQGVLVRPMRDLLDELETQDRRDGRTEGQHRYVTRKVVDVVRYNQHLRTERAPMLPELPAVAA